MKVFAIPLVVFAVILGCAGEVDAESPVIMGSGGVMTAILQTPEFTVDTSEFSSTGEIILDVKFYNPSTKFYGLNWVFENPDAEGVDPDPVKFYEKYEDERRFYIYINDENGDRLGIESMIVTTNDEFILPHGITEKYDDRFVVEVLDIDSLVQNIGAGQKIETQLRLESPELVVGNDYELKVYTDTLIQNPIIFTLPAIQETLTPEPTPSEIIQSEETQDDSKEIPKWIKDIFSFYSEGLINDDELIGALQFLIRSGIIQI